MKPIIRTCAGFTILALAVAPTPTYADFDWIQHDLQNGVSDTSFNAATGEFTIHASSADQLLLHEFGGVLNFPIQNTAVDLVTHFVQVNPDGSADFWGGSLSLTFAMDSGNGFQSYSINGPVYHIVISTVSPAPNPQLSLSGTWLASVVNLPASGVWPDGGSYSTIAGDTFITGDDLSGFQWDRSIAGQAETTYTLAPHDTCLGDCCQDAKFFAQYNPLTQSLHLALSQGSVGFGGTFQSFILETHLDAAVPQSQGNYAGFFTGGTLSIVRPCDWGEPEETISGTITYAAVSILQGAGLRVSARWDPVIAPPSWLGGWDECGLDGLAHLDMTLVGSLDEPLPLTFDWSNGFEYQGGGDNDSLFVYPQTCPSTVCAYPFGDMDLDCDTDLHDYAKAIRCIAGTASFEDKIAGVRVLDADGDLDTDLADFAQWQMSGPQDAPQSCCGLR